MTRHSRARWVLSRGLLTVGGAVAGTAVAWAISGASASADTLPALPQLGHAPAAVSDVLGQAHSSGDTPAVEHPGAGHRQDAQQTAGTSSNSATVAAMAQTVHTTVVPLAHNAGTELRDGAAHLRQAMSDSQHARPQDYRIPKAADLDAVANQLQSSGDKLGLRGAADSLGSGVTDTVHGLRTDLTDAGTRLQDSPGLQPIRKAIDKLTPADAPQLPIIETPAPAGPDASLPNSPVLGSSVALPSAVPAQPAVASAHPAATRHAVSTRPASSPVTPAPRLADHLPAGGLPGGGQPSVPSAPHAPATAPGPAGNTGGSGSSSGPSLVSTFGSFGSSPNAVLSFLSTSTSSRLPAAPGKQPGVSPD